MSDSPRQAAPDRNSSGDGRSRDEFSRFERLTKRLLKVPKKEIQEAEKRAKKLGR
jgi:hypothetical protein